MLTSRAKAIHPLCTICRANLKPENKHITLGSVENTPDSSQRDYYGAGKKKTQDKIISLSIPSVETHKHTHICHAIPQVLIFCVFIAILLEILDNTTFKCISTKIIP